MTESECVYTKQIKLNMKIKNSGVIICLNYWYVQLEGNKERQRPPE